MLGCGHNAIYQKCMISIKMFFSALEHAVKIFHDESCGRGMAACSYIVKVRYFFYNPFFNNLQQRASKLCLLSSFDEQAWFYKNYFMTLGARFL